ncbi:MAG: polyprenol monophosphomannose synthase [Candidatus Hydrogenedentes bacterium]|nr:polyprenol monophosphomannose synthase [Candidatus Hydrogenedentota bacterium]
MSVVIIIPTYNEAENVDEVFKKVHAALPEACVLFVDDNSPDGTREKIKALQATHPDAVALLERDNKEGLGKAYVAGYTHALKTWSEAQLFIQMDADLSHDPAYLPGMVEAAATADLVVASRYVNGVSIVNWPLHRLIISKLGTAFARMATGLPITDCTAGFKCYRREVLEAIGLDTIRSNGYVFQVETSFRAWRMGFHLVDFSIIFYERQHGESKLNLSIALEAFVIICRLGLQKMLGTMPVDTRKPVKRSG